MELVKLKDKGQVTIPASIREEIAAENGDMFEVAVSQGVIILKPVDVISRRPSGKKKQKSVDISRWIGAGKGLFETPKDANAFIQSERAKWK